MSSSSVTLPKVVDDSAELRTLALGLSSLVALSAFVLALSSLFWPSVHDASIMNYLGWRISEGDRPYVDFVDMNFPGGYLFHALLVSVSGAHLALGSNIANVAVLAVNAGLIALCVLRLAGGRCGALAAAGLATCLPLTFGPAQSLQRDELMLPFLLTATYLLLDAETQAARRQFARLAVVGAAIGAALSIKPVGVIWGAAIVCASAFDSSSRRRPSEVLRALFAVGCGFASVWLALLSWLAAKGSLVAFVTLVSSYLPEYSRIDFSVISGGSESNVWGLVQCELQKIDLQSLLWLWAVALVCIVFAKRTGEVERGLRIAAAALLASLLGYWLQRKGWIYHRFPSYAAFSLLAGAVWGRQVDALAVRRSRLPSVGLFAALLLVMSLMSWQAQPALPLRATAQSERVRALVEQLGPAARRGDSIQIFDTAVGGLDTLLRLRVRNATSLVYDFHVLFVPRPSAFAIALRARFLREFSKQPPKRLVIFREGWPSGGYERLDKLPELGRFVAEHYHLDYATPDVRVLALNEPS